MARTPNMNLSADVSGHVPLQRTVKELVEAVDEKLGIPEAVTSAGGGIIIPAGSSVVEALQIIMDHVDPVTEL